MRLAANTRPSSEPAKCKWSDFGQLALSRWLMLTSARRCRSAWPVRLPGAPLSAANRLKHFRKFPTRSDDSAFARPLIPEPAFSAFADHLTLSSALVACRCWCECTAMSVGLRACAHCARMLDQAPKSTSETRNGHLNKRLQPILILSVNLGSLSVTPVDYLPAKVPQRAT